MDEVRWTVCVAQDHSVSEPQPSGEREAAGALSDSESDDVCVYGALAGLSIIVKNVIVLDHRHRGAPDQDAAPSGPGSIARG